VIPDPAEHLRAGSSVLPPQGDSTSPEAVDPVHETKMRLGELGKRQKLSNRDSAAPGYIVSKPHLRHGRNTVGSSP
jgi:hypothetical protein